MRFLITSKNKHLAPPELVPGLIDTTLAWAHKYQGKVEQIWAVAGQQAGGGVLNVESLEELDIILAELPLGPFSETEVYPLVDLESSLQHQKQMAQALTAGVQG